MIERPNPKAGSEDDDGNELDGVTGEARKPGPKPTEKPMPENGNDGRSPDGEMG